MSATDNNDIFQPGYNYGIFMDLAAPGVFVRMTSYDANFSPIYTLNTGTSFSAPHVSALAGLILSVDPTLSIQQVQDIMETTAKDLWTSGWDDHYGYGRINAYEALKYTLENYGGTISGNVTFTEDLNLTNGVTLTIAAGTTVKLDPGVDLWFRNGSRLVATGTATNPITFTSTSSNPGPGSWGTIYLLGDNNQLEYCTVEYGDWGVKIQGYPSASSGNVVRNSLFRFNDQGLRLDNSTVTVENTTLENNRHAYIILNNATVTIRDNVVKNNNRDGIYSSGSVIDIFDSEFENNGLGDVNTIHGVYAFGGSDVYLGSRSFIPIPYQDQVAGFNTIRNNRGAGIYVSSHAGTKVTAGYVSFPIYSAGQNSLYGNGTKSGTGFTGKDFYNLNSTTMKAQNNYWGGNCPPDASQIYGSVTTSYCLGSPPSAAMALRYDLSALEKAGRINTVTTAGQNSYDDTQFKKDLIVEYKRIITQQPGSPQALAAVQNYYSLVRTDKENKLQELSIVMGYLNGIYTTNKNLEFGKIALQLMILEARRVEDLTTAIKLSDDALTVLAGEDKAGVLFNLIFYALQVGDLQKAKYLAALYSKEYPNKTGEIAFLANSLAKAPGELQQSGSSVIPVPAAFPGKKPVGKSDMTPLSFKSMANYPNPFNPTTNFRYSLPQDGQVEIQIFNSLSQKIRLLEKTSKPAGEYHVEWDGRNDTGVAVGSGVYFYRFVFRPSGKSSQPVSQSGKLTLLR